jgi:hypothetical protein
MPPTSGTARELNSRCTSADERLTCQGPSASRPSGTTRLCTVRRHVYLRWISAICRHTVPPARHVGRHRAEQPRFAGLSFVRTVASGAFVSDARRRTLLPSRWSRFFVKGKCSMPMTLRSPNHHVGLPRLDGGRTSAAMPSADYWLSASGLTRTSAPSFRQASSPDSKAVVDTCSGSNRHGGREQCIADECSKGLQKLELIGLVEICAGRLAVRIEPPLDPCLVLIEIWKTARGGFVRGPSRGARRQCLDGSRTRPGVLQSARRRCDAAEGGCRNGAARPRTPVVPTTPRRRIPLSVSLDHRCPR